MIHPDPETFVSITFALKMPPSFFIAKPEAAEPIDLASCHFRSLRSTTQAMRRQSTRKGELFIDFMGVLKKKGIIFPQEQVSGFNESTENGEEIERASVSLRRQWSMGLGPIPNVVRLVESKGVLVLPLHDAVDKVDAYSTWNGKQPCMLISYQKTASRIRFDVSHELCHLAMHEDVAASDAAAEHQANRFAGAFLAPRESFAEECPRRWSYEAFRRLKERWKMSIQALLYRAKDLGIISVSTQRRAMIQLGIDGKRKNEGEQWPKEKPVLVTQAIELLSDQVTLDGLAQELSVYPAELKDMLGLCVPAETLNKLDRKNDAGPAKIVRLHQQ